MAHIGLMTDWMKYGDLCPLPGDIIEFKRSRGVYNHVGIADGEYGIYHFSGEPTMGYEVGIQGFKLKARFRYDKLRLVAGGCLMRINNSEDNTESARIPLGVSEIIQRCEEQLGKGYGTYNVVRNNCEHKATEMRYGSPSSEQVLRAKKLVLMSVSAPLKVAKLPLRRLFQQRSQTEEKSKSEILMCR